MASSDRDRSTNPRSTVWHVVVCSYKGVDMFECNLQRGQSGDVCLFASTLNVNMFGGEGFICPQLGHGATSVSRDRGIALWYLCLVDV